jgi:Cytochrome C oxidase, cbb3-type, subunit III
MRGRDLFLMNCAHCHGDDARGTEEGPDLTKFQKSEARIASVVKNGIKGEMPRFGQKLTAADVKMLIRFILLPCRVSPSLAAEILPRALRGVANRTLLLHLNRYV